MKIERLSENQIRCTLNKSDLASRQLKINELAYGSEKAKQLFHDMMKQASYELGFEIDDTPVMIEAIPVSAECIVLIVTKVDNPDELDTRFSRFSPSDMDSDYHSSYQADDDFDYPNIESIGGDSDFGSSEPAPTANEELDNIDSDQSATSENSVWGDELVNLFSKVKDYLQKNTNLDKNTDSSKNDNVVDGFIPLSQQLAKKFVAAAASNGLVNTGKKADATDTSKDSKKASDSKQTITRVFSFNSLDDISDVANILDKFYADSNSLYKDKTDNIYYLVLSKNTCSSVNFNKVCNILTEYGSKETLGTGCAGFFKEHFECIIDKHAIHVLAKL